ncbi:MAG: serine/threonine-protein kinase [Planctomycetota bacterium]|nr:serine/threonine-protein kinase [Planctomycetota bacterium]
MTEREPPTGQGDANLEERLDRIAEEYLNRLQAGESPDREALLAEHLDIAEVLGHHLDLVEKLRAAAADAPAPEEVAGADPVPSELRYQHRDARSFQEAPDRIGPYRIIRELGTGGMGVVYLAEQDEPLRRQVALKHIKLGMDTREVVARFDNERHALALMNHPHIAQVFEAGAAENGRPYFVMEYVDGMPVTEYCDQRRLGIPDRLALFRRVCDAVQHAHQKGVIHRDLKPSNILVTGENGGAAPKIIDFGVAKATNQRIAEKTAFTELGRVLGTPEYMSPEQAVADIQDVDTRSDVYSLGVVLYELLVGVLPFDPQELRKLPYEEIRRRIREEEPPKPSTRISGLGQNGEVASRRQRADTQSLVRLIRGDLDWITMKAMEKDPGRRYGTVSEFSADLDRYLQDEPVVARPPSAMYRMAKLVRRNKTKVTAAAFVAFALVAGTVVSTWSLIEARVALREKEQERQRTEDEKEKTREALVMAEEETAAAQISWARAEREAEKQTRIRRFLVDMFGSARPEDRGPNVKVIDVLKGAYRKIATEFADLPEIQSALHTTIANTYLTLAMHNEAERHALAAHDINRRIYGEDHPETAVPMRDLVTVYRGQGRLEEAEDLARKTLKKYRDALEGDDRLRLELQVALTFVLVEAGKLGEAEQVGRETVDELRLLYGVDDRVTIDGLCALASVRGRQGFTRENWELLLEASEAAARVFGATNSVTMGILSLLARGYQASGDLGTAREILYRVLESEKRDLGENHSATLQTLASIALLLRDLDQHQEAERLCREVLQKAEIAMPGRRLIRVRSQKLLIVLLKEGRRFEEAEKIAREFLEESRRIEGPDHQNTLYLMNILAQVVGDSGRLDEAEPICRELVASLERTLGREHQDYLEALVSLSIVLRRQGKHEEAIRIHRTATLAMNRILGQDNPTALQYMNSLANMLYKTSNFEEAEPLRRRVVAIARKSLSRDNWRRSQYMRDHGVTLLSLKRYSEAEALLLESCEQLESLLGPVHREVIGTFEYLRDLYIATGREDKVEEYTAAIDSRRVQAEVQARRELPVSSPDVGKGILSGILETP